MLSTYEFYPPYDQTTHSSLPTIEAPVDFVFTYDEPSILSR